MLRRQGRGRLLAATAACLLALNAPTATATARTAIGDTASTANIASESYAFPLAVHNGSASPVDRTVGARPLDTVYITAPNATTYEWWYFDATATDLAASVVLQPVVEGGAFVLVLDLQYTDARGRRMAPQFMLPYANGSFATAGQGSNMIAADGQWAYSETPDLSSVAFDLDLPSAGVSGSIKFQSIAPPHVACSPIHRGARLDFYWNLFWVNLIPDAVVTVDLKLNGTPVAFEGVGYHDKNWAPTPYNADLDQWYWGHGRAGPYSVVWFYRLNAAGQLDASAYIAENGKILYASCEGLIVRPFTDHGILYPIPYPYSDAIRGVHVSIDAGSIGKFAFTATQKHDILKLPSYHRLTGTFAGGKVGHANATGIALWEMQGPFNSSKTAST